MPEKITLYLLSGLAANDYMFQNLIFPENVHPVYLPWIPNDAEDTLSTYAHKMIDNYDIKGGQMILGLSMGGIVASEIQKFLPQNRLILVSSISHSGQLPPAYKNSALFPGLVFTIKHRLSLPDSMLAFPFQPISEEHMKEVKANMRDASTKHLIWVCDQIRKWDHKEPHRNIVHIHGTADRVFPTITIKCDEKIEGGGHLMILNRSEEINSWLKSVLADQ